MDSGAIRLSLCLEMSIIGLTKAISSLLRGNLYSVRLEVVTRERQVCYFSKRSLARHVDGIQRFSHLSRNVVSRTKLRGGA